MRGITRWKFSSPEHWHKPSSRSEHSKADTFLVGLLERVMGFELYTRKTNIGEQYKAVTERPEVVERFMFLADGAHAECAK